MVFNMEDVISTDNFDKTLSKAKEWCIKNLPKYILDFKKEIDCDIFHYTIDDEMIGSDMRLDNEERGLIRVSTRKLKWYFEREEFFGKHGGREPIEIDPESMFVHEIAEFAILNKMGLLNQPGYITNATNAHQIARAMENINRMERNLKRWPD